MTLRSFLILTTLLIAGNLESSATGNVETMLTVLREHVATLPSLFRSKPERIQAQLAQLEEPLNRIVTYAKNTPRSTSGIIQSFLNFYTMFPSTQLQRIKRYTAAQLSNDLTQLTNAIIDRSTQGLPLDIAQDMIAINMTIQPLLHTAWYSPGPWYKECKQKIIHYIKQYPSATVLTAGLLTALIIISTSKQTDQLIPLSSHST